MSQTPDMRQFLDDWRYDPDNNVRLARGVDGREIMLVRLPMGFEQYDVEGRPDGKRRHDAESALEFQRARQAAAHRAGAEDAFKLAAADCAELFDEATIYYYRFVHFFHLKDWVRAERDATRILHLLDYVSRYAEHEEDRAQAERWQPDITRMNAIVRGMISLGKGRKDEALKGAQENVEGIKGIDEHLIDPRELADALLEEFRESFAIRPVFRQREKSTFLLRGDYWTIRYQGQVARLRATRGLHCLACLLRQPGREFHVSELIAEFAEIPVLAEVAGADQRPSGSEFAAANALGSDPILDARAKTEYRRQLQDLRQDLEEAEQFGDRERAAQAQAEMNSISEQLASAVGLGGKKRRVGSHAERARSTVTKRIKESINKIGVVIPALGRHLGARIKTGYFCSYNPHPDRPVAWKF